MCVCVLCLCVCSVCVCVCVCARIHMRMHACMGVCMHIYQHVCVHVPIHICPSDLQSVPFSFAASSGGITDRGYDGAPHQQSLLVFVNVVCVITVCMITTTVFGSGNKKDA